MTLEDKIIENNRHYNLIQSAIEGNNLMTNKSPYLVVNQDCIDVCVSVWKKHMSGDERNTYMPMEFTFDDDNMLYLTANGTYSKKHFKKPLKWLNKLFDMEVESDLSLKEVIIEHNRMKKIINDTIKNIMFDEYKNWLLFYPQSENILLSSIKKLDDKTRGIDFTLDENNNLCLIENNDYKKVDTEKAYNIWNKILAKKI